MQRTAVISECGAYRYRLGREWDEALPVLAWVMLNPSTADAEQDDPTIRRCMGFARGWGYGGIEVANVFGYRATDPKELASIRDPFGPEWSRHMFDVVSSYPVVAAWGAKAGRDGRELGVYLTTKARLLFPPVRCLGTTKNGHPRHPLYVRADTLPVPFEMAA